MPQTDVLTALVEWSRSAPRGAKARVARHLGWPPQRVSNALAVARRGRRSPDVDRLAAVLLLGRDAESAVDSLVVAAPRPTRLDDLVAEVVAATGAPAEYVVELVRSRYLTVRNMFDPHEYVFAALVDGNKGEGSGLCARCGTTSG